MVAMTEEHEQNIAQEFASSLLVSLCHQMAGCNMKNLEAESC
jgi:hypothetical protein